MTTGQRYEFRIRAVNAAGNGPATDPVSAYPGIEEAHGVRLWNFKVEPGDDRLALRWTVVGNSNRSPRVFYRIEWSDFDTENVESAEFSSWARTPEYTITGLKPGTSYSLILLVEPPYTTQTARQAFSWGATTTGTAPMAPPVGAPAFEWARVNGAELALRFDQGLDESSVPAAGAFAVSVAGASRAVSSVSVRQSLVTLTLASAVSAGETVTVGYTPPSTGKLRLDGGGAAVAAFTGQSVTNDTPSGQPQVQPPPECRISRK